MAAKLLKRLRKNKIFLHVGPHKTGTTAIQAALNRSNGIIYPSVTEWGPGHALYAWHALGINNNSSNPDLLCNLVHECSQKDLPIVLSSEEFCYAIMPYANREGIIKLANEFEVELIVTLTPLAGRITSVAQELIKHKHLIDFESEQSLLEIMKGQPGLQPQFLEHFFDLAPWHKIHVIFVDKTKPRDLFDSFSSVLGIPLNYDPDDISYTNHRLPYGQLAFLDVLNKLVPNAPRSDIFAAARVASQKAIEMIPDLALVPYPPLPKEVETQLHKIWVKQMELIRDWEKMGAIRVYY